MPPLTPKEVRSFVVRLIMMGPPGGGKGTQSKMLLANQPDITHLSTGDYLRAQIRANTVLGQNVSQYTRKSKLVPDDVMIELISSMLQQDEVCGSWILDGFPRTPSQAEALIKLLEHLEQPVDMVIWLEVSENILVERLSRRLTCMRCGNTYSMDDHQEGDKCLTNGCEGHLRWRKDDQDTEGIRRRIHTFHDETEPILGVLFEAYPHARVDGDASAEEVAHNVQQSLLAR